MQEYLQLYRKIFNKLHLPFEMSHGSRHINRNEFSRIGDK